MNEDQPMPLLAHLKELRKRLMIVVAVFALAFAGGMAVSPYILDYLKSVPPASGISWNVFSPWDGVKLYVNIAVFLAATATMPFALHQLWLFVCKGMQKHERTAALRYIPVALLCLALGIAFGYYVVFPMSFAFVHDISAKLNVVETYGATQYFGFMFNIVIPVGAAFELPIVVMFLTGIGLLSPNRLRKFRRYAYLILVVVSTAITPPDMMSAFIVLIPLAVLYEASVWLSGFVYRRSAARMNAGSLQPYG